MKVRARAPPLGLVWSSIGSLSGDAGVSWRALPRRAELAKDRNEAQLQRAISSLTDALDFVGDEFHHGKRVALMAAAIAGEMDWPRSRCEAMLYAGMIHDCGVSRAKEHRALTESLLYGRMRSSTACAVRPIWRLARPWRTSRPWCAGTTRAGRHCCMKISRTIFA